MSSQLVRASPYITGGGLVAWFVGDGAATGDAGSTIVRLAQTALIPLAGYASNYFIVNVWPNISKKWQEHAIRMEEIRAASISGQLSKVARQLGEVNSRLQSAEALSLSKDRTIEALNVQIVAMEESHRKHLDAMIQGYERKLDSANEKLHKLLNHANDSPAQQGRVERMIEEVQEQTKVNHDGIQHGNETLNSIDRRIPPQPIASGNSAG